MRYSRVWVVLMLSTAGFADTLVLRTGRTIDGTVLTLSGTPREIRMEVGGKIQSFNVSDVSSVNFGSTPEPGAKPTPETQQPDLTGTWTGIQTDPNTGNPFKVTIEIGENHQNDVVATMVGPWGVYLPSGIVAFSGSHNDDRFPLTVLCAAPGFQNPAKHIGQITVLSKDRFLERVQRETGCEVDVTFNRVK